ncbi:metal ABC transporter permease [Staphylococcus aureus]
MIIASLISVISSIVGLYYSYIYNILSGATIVLCTFVIYIITLFFHKIYE